MKLFTVTNIVLDVICCRTHAAQYQSLVKTPRTRITGEEKDNNKNVPLSIRREKSYVQRKRSGRSQINCTPNQDSIPHIKRFVAVETERSEGQYFMFWLYFANLQV